MIRVCVVGMYVLEWTCVMITHHSSIQDWLAQLLTTLLECAHFTYIQVLTSELSRYIYDVCDLCRFMFVFFMFLHHFVILTDVH